MVRMFVRSIGGESDCRPTNHTVGTVAKPANDFDLADRRGGTTSRRAAFWNPNNLGNVSVCDPVVVGFGADLLDTKILIERANCC